MWLESYSVILIVTKVCIDWCVIGEECLISGIFYFGSRWELKFLFRFVFVLFFAFVLRLDEFTIKSQIYIFMGLPWWLSGIESACSAEAAGDAGSVPGSGRSPGGWHGNPLQYSCLENTMDRGAWHSTVIGLWRIRHNWIDLACTYTYLTYRLWFFYSCNYWSLFSPFLFYIRHVWFGTSFAVQGLRPCCRFNPWPGSSTCL